MNLLLSWIDDLFGIFFPRICAGCGNNLWKHEKIVCGSCGFHLPMTNFHLFPDNPVAQLFTGRVNILCASAFLYFNKGNRVQRLIHQLKYKGRMDVGVHLGFQYGSCLSKTAPFQNSHVIIPVPLHKKKLARRGYNQSEQFALGLSESMKVPVDTTILIRKTANDSQTRKSRFGRYQNVKEIFEVKHPESIKGRQVLLVDDVVTTGSTLESCAMKLGEIDGVTVAIACIAFTSA